MEELIKIAPQIGTAIVIVAAIFIGIDRLGKKQHNDRIPRAEFDALRRDYEALRDLVYDHIQRRPRDSIPG